MKPFEHNGKKFSNADAWRSSKAMTGGQQTTQLEEPPGVGEDSEDPGAVVDMHGPAHEVHITHEPEMGAHHVHSIHQDGHEHHSDHASAGEAHDHARQLAAADEDGEQDMEEQEPEEMPA